MTQPRRPHHRRLLWTGVAVLTCGLVVLGYVGWQVEGTTAVSRHRQAQTVERLEREWQQPVPADPIALAVPADAIAVVRVPRFGDGYAVPVVEGVDDAALADGLGHFDGTARPGGVGNFALAGHRITHGQPLRDLPSLRPGDRVVVETRSAVFTYAVDTDPRALQVSDRAGWVVAPRPVNPSPLGPQPSVSRRVITLVTCAELFHTDRRTVVFGHLVDRTNR